MQTALVNATMGLRGFDANQPISAADANAFVRHGYTFAIRYVRRDRVNAHDLNLAEVYALLSAGLGIMCVQHVESEASWIPTAEKGRANGEAAANELAQLLPIGSMVWCDLEGVDPSVPAADVIAYANEWHAAVSGDGYLPGLYVGWHAGISAHDLYHALPFKHYWAAYNLNADQGPVTRGVCMRQKLRAPGDIPVGIDAVDFDVNIITGDALGGVPVIVLPAPNPIA